jgi:hypothetical protein
MSTLIIYPYRLGQTWVFDDPRTGLKEEAFVLGSSEMITRLVEARQIPNPEKGFTLHFSDEPFAGYDAEFTWLRSDDAQVVPGKDGSASQLFGNWYRGLVDGLEMEGWLCPALGLYFHAAPPRMFAKAEPLPAGVDPVWHIARDAAMAVRFVSAD